MNVVSVGWVCHAFFVHLLLIQVVRQVLAPCLVGREDEREWRGGWYEIRMQRGGILTRGRCGVRYVTLTLFVSDISEARLYFLALWDEGTRDGGETDGEHTTKK